MSRLLRHVVCRKHRNDACASIGTQIRTRNAHTHAVKEDIQRRGGEIQASYRAPRKTISPSRTSLVTCFGVAGVSLPGLIFSGHSPFRPSWLCKNTCPQWEASPCLAFTWLGRSPQKLGLALGTRAEPDRSTDAARGAPAAPLSRCSSPTQPNAQGNEAAQ